MTDTTYSITVFNHSGEERAYFLFAKFPEVSGVLGGPVFQNVWVKAPPIPSPNGTTDFQITKEFFGVCGTSQQKLDIDVVVKTSDWANVSLADNSAKGTHLLMTGGPAGDSAQFVPAATTQSCNKPGSYEIECKNFEFGSGANQYIGLGGKDPKVSDKIVPIASFMARPETTSIITPKVVYYISWGTVQQGQIIDVKTYAQPAEINFTGKASKNVAITDNKDGKWTYSWQ